MNKDCCGACPAGCVLEAAGHRPVAGSVKATPGMLTWEERAPVPPAVAEYAIEERQELLDQIAGLRRALAACAATLPGVTYMDPPDGGDVPVAEQLRRMGEDAARWRFCAPLIAEQLGTSVAALGGSVDGLRAEDARGAKL